MAKLLDRYRAGEIGEVWQELIDLDAAVRQPAQLAAARAVADEAMTRALQNLELLVQRLRAAGYHFARPEQALVVAEGAAAAAEIARFEAELGPLPVAVAAFYARIVEVDLSGTFEAWEPPGALRPESSLALLADDARCYCDPLVVPPLIALRNELSERRDELEELEDDEALLVSFSGDAMAKRDGKGGLYGIVLPDPGFDTDLEAYDATTFTDYLRDALRWGGFPGWLHYAEPPVATIETLRADFLPF